MDFEVATGLVGKKSKNSMGQGPGFERLRQLPPQLFHPLAALGRDVYLRGLMTIFQMAR